MSPFVIKKVKSFQKLLIMDKDKYRKKETNAKDESIVCPFCKGYGYLNDSTSPGSPCSTCGGSGWLTMSQLDQWEFENHTDEWQ